MSEEKQKFSGRDLADAISAARRHFGVTRAEIGYEVLQSSRMGLVGEGAPMVEIMAWKREGGAPPPPAGYEPRSGFADRTPRERGPRGGHGRGGGGERGGGGDRGGRPERGPSRGGDRGPRGGAGRGRSGEGRSFRGGDDEFHPPLRNQVREVENVELAPLLPATDVTDQHAVLERLARGLTEGLGLSLEFTGIEETSAGLRVKLDGEDVPLLLESDAEGLEALQYLANRILQKDGRIPNRISFDAGSFRAKAEAKLIADALRIADEVLESGQPKKLQALGPYERRLVHIALAEREGIKTFSTGSGYHRRLHIAPIDAPEPTEPTEA